MKIIDKPIIFKVYYCSQDTHNNTLRTFLLIPCFVFRCKNNTLMD